MGRRWWAERGGGAYVTERFASASPLLSTEENSPSLTRRINVSQVSSLGDASLSYSDLLGWESKRKSFLSLLDEVWRTRALGDFLSHMFVAEGAVDVAAEPALALWDMAALAMIVEEAGGKYSSLDGVEGPFGASGVSTNGRLHQEFLSRINDGSQE
jgi:histidinol-phosphatase